MAAVLRYRLLGKYRSYRGDWRGASRNYARLVKLQPQQVKWREHLMHSLFKDRNYEASLEEVSSLLDSYPSRVQYLEWSVKCLIQLGRHEDAENVAQKILAIENNNIFALMTCGELLVDDGKYEAALNYLNHASDVANRDDREMVSRIYYFKGLAYERLNYSEQARESYDTARQWSTKLLVEKLGAGALHKIHGNIELAKQKFELQAEDDPKNAELFFQLGQIYSQLGETKPATEAYQTFVKYDEVLEKEGRILDENLIIFDAYMSRNYACSPRAIFEYMLKDARFRQFRFVWMIRGMSLTRHWKFLFNPRVKLVKYKSHDYFRTYARAKYWVTNSRLPFIEKSHKEQVYIQCWHGTPLKRLGHSIIDNFSGARHDKDSMIDLYDHETKKFDYFVSPSAKATELLDDAFKLKDFNVEILEAGYPRNDFLHTFKTADVERVRKRLGIPAGKKVLLYAPTWRDDQRSETRNGYTYKAEADFDRLRQELGDNWVILFRAHYFVANSFNFSKYKNFIIDVSSHDDINDLYITADALMTDYSSVFFDYANLGRPIIFFMYDLDHYKDHLRGFYTDLKDLPGDIAKTEDEVITILKDLPAYQQKHHETYQTFTNTYNPLDDGKAAERVVNAVIRK